MTSGSITDGTRTAQGQYRRFVRRKKILLVLLAALLALSFIVDLAIGPASYPLKEVIAALFSPGAVPVQVRTVLWEIRMPTALLAMAVGAALSVAGAQMQTILANPLASPFTLGISAAAGFGASLALASGVALLPFALDYIVPLNAFAMAMLAALLIHFFSLQRQATTEIVVLLGIALVFAFNSLLALVQYFASEQAIAAVVFWTLGSLTKATWPKVVTIFTVLVLVIPIFMHRAWTLTALRLGEEKAASFGIDVRQMRLETMLLVALLAAIPVSFVGTIGFIGLVGPHIARMLIGEDQRFFLPASVLSGALLLSLSSIISKSVMPGTILPIGIVTSLIGIPFFLMLIFAKVRGR